ncbi:MAG: hypothetical protein AAFN00_20370 [Cyanobacteria bacterium J06558_2]
MSSNGDNIKRDNISFRTHCFTAPPLEGRPRVPQGHNIAVRRKGMLP